MPMGCSTLTVSQISSYTTLHSMSYRKNCILCIMPDKGHHLLQYHVLQEPYSSSAATC